MIREVDSVTGRDTYVVCNALAYAIITIGRRPTQFQEYSDSLDMMKLLQYYAPASMGADYFLNNARRHIDGVSFKDDNVVSMMDALKADIDKKLKE